MVLNRERPVMAIVHPDDLSPPSQVRGRPVRTIAAALRALPAPDVAFADDMTEVLRSAGPAPDDPWAR